MAKGSSPWGRERMPPARPSNRTTILAGLVVGSLALAACSSMPSLTGGGSPFAGASSVDRTFINAAQTWDFDKDGTATCDEWKNYVATLLRESDANGDGALDATEFQHMAKTDRLFTIADLGYFDANGDGKVTADELTGKQNPAFRLLDKSGDCRLDRNESVRVLPVDAPKAAPPPDQQIPGARR